MLRSVAVLCCLLVACTETGPPLVASDVEITGPMPGMSMSAGYFVLANRTGDAIEITRVTSPQYASVEMHETRVENGVAQMRRLDVLVVPARGEVRLERGGKHLMLMRPRDTAAGVRLQLYSGDTPVLTIDYDIPAS